MSTDDRPEAMHPDAVEVACTGTLFDARHLAGLLESEGIRTFIPNENVLNTYDGAAVGWEGGVRILVPSDRAAEARDIVAAWEARRRDAARPSED